MKVLQADKIGSATSPLNLTKTVSVIDENKRRNRAMWWSFEL